MKFLHKIYFLLKDHHKFLFNAFTCALFFHLFAMDTFAAPSITGLKGEIEKGGIIQIDGTEFGFSGPNIRIYDDFEDGAEGELIDQNAVVGLWDSLNGPVYDSRGSSGSYSARLIDNDAMKQIRALFPGTTEFFLSYNLSVPPGSNFPNTSTPNTFAPDSSWKVAWIMDGSKGYQGDDDVCLPTWPNGTYWSLAGNDVGIQPGFTEVGRPGTSSRWFSFGNWNEIAMWFKGGQVPEVDLGKIWFSGMSAEFGQKIFNYEDRVLFDGDDNSYDDAVSEWTNLNIPGWHRGGGTNVNALYDDIYFAIGDNAAARIEIGNSPVYENNTKNSFVIPVTWSDNSIIAQLYESAFSIGDEVYLFVLDSNNIPSEGYGPIVFSEFIPTLIEKNPIGITRNVTPSFNLYTDVSGTLSYQGPCTSSVSSLLNGEVELTFNQLSYGIYSDCTITVTDANGNTSTPLQIPEFAITYPSDNDLDKDVDIFDYNILLGNFGAQSDCQNQADTNEDCQIDIFDYNSLLGDFGKSL